MITQLYIFSPGTYVVAEEWNANFRVLMNANLAHQEAIVDANDVILFKGGDYTYVYNRVNNEQNSFNIISNSIVPVVDCEYYKDLLGDSDELNVPVKTGDLEGEARIIIKTHNNRVLSPVNITYNGSKNDIVWENGIAQWYLAGTKFIFLLERNGKLYVKMIATE